MSNEVDPTGTPAGIASDAAFEPNAGKTNRAKSLLASSNAPPISPVTATGHHNDTVVPAVESDREVPAASETVERTIEEPALPMPMSTAEMTEAAPTDSLRRSMRTNATQVSHTSHNEAQSEEESGGEDTDEPDNDKARDWKPGEIDDYEDEDEDEELETQQLQRIIEATPRSGWVDPR